MDIPCWLLVLVLGAFSIVRLVQAQDQQGFISLDCGLPVDEPSPYIESSTGLQFLSDANFTTTGKTGNIQANPENTYIKPYTTLRYFPDGIRNCYSLSVEKYRKYLIRARFIYGNYNGLNLYPVFDLYLGPNPWATINLLNFVNGTTKEILHTPISNSLQICLVKTGLSTPVISALELRPLGNDSYSTASGSVNLSYRLYAKKTNSFLRYPDDVYDREWFSSFTTKWTQISTTLEVSNDGEDLPPKKIFATGGTASNASRPMSILWIPIHPGDQYYFYSYFAEIQDLHTNETREFDLIWNGDVVVKAYRPLKLAVGTLMNKSPTTCASGLCVFELSRTSRSTLPPLFNAIEVYTVIQFPQPETNENDVLAIKSIEAAYGLSRINWQGDPCVPQQLMWDAINCSNTDISIPPRITSLNLPSSGLTGIISAAIQNLTQLVKLDLSNNSLTGEIPEFLGNMKSLLVINLSMNDLNGSIPQSLQRKGLKLFLQGNPRLFPSGPPPNPLGSSPTKRHGSSILVPTIASVGSVAILIATLALYLVLRKKKRSTVEVVYPPSSRPDGNVVHANSPEPPVEMNKRRFSYPEVINMTNNFEKVVGEGGRSIVYCGKINDSEQVAVKLLSLSSPLGDKEFKEEVDLLLKVHHTNLVSLVGYCNEEDHLAFIYEFVPNGNLSQHLSGKGLRSVVNWGIRLRIAVGVALGLEYLHVGCSSPMVHGDVKTTNILLDEHYKAKLTCFGLPVGGKPHLSTVISDSPGYLDPEYYQTSRLSEKSDVYSFGIVLLELITNQPVIDQKRRKSHLTQWVGSMLKGGDITKIMDPNLNGDYDSRSVWRALELAMSCAAPISAKRPTISHVVIELRECLVYENSKRDNSRGMASPSSAQVSMNFNTEMIPRAR